MNFRFGIFAVKADCEASRLQPSLRAAHHAHDLAGVFAVKVGIGNGRLFTPPIVTDVLLL